MAQETVERSVMKVDNFALTMHQACPAKYNLRIRQRWESRVKGGALNFGLALHAGLAEWYASRDLPKAILAIREAWNEKDVGIDDHRTLAKCEQVLFAYCRQYPHEQFKFVGSTDGSPIIERSFSLPLVVPGTDTQICTFDGIPIEYGGIFDGLVEFGPTLYVIDHKSTSQLGAYYMNQFKPNNQITGYVWGAQQLSGRRVGGAFINAICITRGGNISFKRDVTTREPEEIARWCRDVQSTCNEIRRHELDGHFPWRTTSCTQYGLCQFHGVHVIADDATQKLKLEQDYIQREWNFEARDEAAQVNE